MRRKNLEARRADYLYHLNSRRRDTQTIESLARTWLLEPGVFSPLLDESTILFTRAVLEYAPTTLVEIGCGAGVTSVTVALEMQCPVIAVDITSEAVRNTGLNIERHGVQEYVSVHSGDLLNPVPPVSEAVVFWNSNFIDAEPPDATPLGRAIYDPGYLAHQRFFAQCAERNPELSKVLLGFSTLGNHELLERVANESGWWLQTIRSWPSVRNPDVRYQLLDFAWSGRRPLESKRP